MILEPKKLSTKHSVKEARPKGPFKPKPKVSGGKFQKGKVLKRSELITQKEKEKMQHKYNKAMRKERNPKLQPMRPASALQVAIEKEEEMRRFVGEGGGGSGEAARRLGKGQREAKATTANKRAVQEYEERRREKQVAREVTSEQFRVVGLTDLSRKEGFFFAFRFLLCKVRVFSEGVRYGFSFEKGQ